MKYIIKHNLMLLMKKFPYVKYAIKQLEFNKKIYDLNIKNFWIACNKRLAYELDCLINFQFTNNIDDDFNDFDAVNLVCHTFICENIIKTWYFNLTKSNNESWNSYINKQKIFSSKFSLYKEIPFIEKNTDLLSFIRSMVFAHPMNYDRKPKKPKDLYLCSNVRFINKFLKHSKIVKKYNKDADIMVDLTKYEGDKITAKYICFSSNDIIRYVDIMMNLICCKETEEILNKLNEEMKEKVSQFKLTIDEKNKSNTISEFIRIIQNKEIFDEYNNLILNELYILKFIFSNNKKFQKEFLDYLWEIFLKIINTAKEDILRIDFNDDFNISYEILGIYNGIEPSDEWRNYRIEKYHYLVEKAINEIKTNKFCKNLNQINYSFDDRDKIADYNYAKTLLQHYKKKFAKSFNSKSYAEFHAYILQDIYFINKYRNLL